MYLPYYNIFPALGQASNTQVNEELCSLTTATAPGRVGFGSLVIEAWRGLDPPLARRGRRSGGASDRSESNQSGWCLEKVDQT